MKKTKKYHTFLSKRLSCQALRDQLRRASSVVVLMIIDPRLELARFKCRLLLDLQEAKCSERSFFLNLSPSVGRLFGRSFKI